MLPIYLRSNTWAAILFSNKITICILLIYFSVLAFYFSAVGSLSNHIMAYKNILVIQVK